MGTALPRVLIASPANATANNGNWHTAARWAQMLQPDCAVTIAQDWDGTPFEPCWPCMPGARRRL
jgi:hypothetical protein